MPNSNVTFPFQISDWERVNPGFTAAWKFRVRYVEKLILSKEKEEIEEEEEKN